MAYWVRTKGSVGVWYQNQSDYVTAASTGTESSWTKLICEHEIGVADTTIDLDDAIGQPGATGDQIAGPEHGITLKLKGFLRSQAASWGSTDAIASSPEFALIADVLGNSASRNYQASSVTTGSDANTVQLASGTYADGHFVGFGASATTVDVRGFIKTAATLELFEDAESVAVTGDHGYGAVTAYTSSDQPTAKTFRILGGSAWQDIRLVGCMPSRVTLTLNTGQVPQYEIEYTATKLVWDSSGDDLVPGESYNALPTAIGDNGGRFTVDLYSTSDGTVDTTDVYCGAVNQTLTVTREQVPISCPSALQGVSNVVLGDPEVMMTMEVPIADSDISNSSSKTVWDNRYTARTAFSVCYYLGNTAGKIFALCIPQARLSKRPTLAQVGGKIVGHALEMKPAAYSGDTSSTAPGDTALRVAIA